jgi:hypothetical protein
VILAQVQFQHAPIVVPEPAQRAGADDGRHLVLPPAALLPTKAHRFALRMRVMW